MYTVFFRNADTGEVGDIIEWSTPGFTRRRYEIVLWELRLHTGHNWSRVEALLYRGLVARKLSILDEADDVFLLDTVDGRLYVNGVLVRQMGGAV